MFAIYFFFFSSRRRHTRCLSDWSSDVCSSDLPRNGRIAEMRNHTTNDEPFRRPTSPPARPNERSEERRVGKECRSRWAAEHEKKKEKTCKERERRTDKRRR